MSKAIMRVKVNRHHIDDADVQMAHRCAIAMAIKDVSDDIAWASVARDIIKIAYHSDNMVYSYHTPRSAKNFIVDFDNNRAPRPFTLEILQEDFVSMHPRRMNQAKIEEMRKKRARVAKVEGRSLRDVTAEDVKEYEEAMGKPIEVATPAVVRKPKARPEESQVEVARKAIAVALTEVGEEKSGVLCDAVTSLGLSSATYYRAYNGMKADGTVVKEGHSGLIKLARKPRRKPDVTKIRETIKANARPYKKRATASDVLSQINW